jgi:hypothetical protein
VDRIDGVNFDNPRVFAPTNRILVICPGDIPTNQFEGMLQGHKDNEKAIAGRMGPLGNKVTRGTYWVLYTFGTGSKNRPVGPPPGDLGAEQEFGKMKHSLAGTATGMGYKVNVGSRNVRFEWLVGYDDKEKAQSEAKKWKESELAKGDEGDIRSVRWWPVMANRFGDAKVQREVLSHLAFDSSGEVFIARTEVDTKLMLFSISNWASRALEVQAGAPPPKDPNAPKP